MIASHNSMSYLRAKNPWLNIFSKYWRCQGKTLVEQINAGVKLFDLRVVYTSNGWRFTCGRITLSDGVKPEVAIELLENKGLYYRLVLEHGGHDAEREFSRWVRHMVIDKKASYGVDYLIKRQNLSVVKPYGDKFVFIDKSLGAFLPPDKMYFTPKKWAEAYNRITKWKKYEKERVYFYDYV